MVGAHFTQDGTLWVERQPKRGQRHDRKCRSALDSASLAEGKTLLAAIQARLIVDQVTRYGTVARDLPQDPIDEKREGNRRGDEG